jgi:UDP-N-acetylmuramoyl-L-alanyl-D-glutamate--2,6-diaminopimelate ligase
MQAKEITKEKVVTMLGCGEKKKKKKRPQMGSIAARLSDFTIITSDNPRHEEPGAIINDILAGLKNTKTPYKVIENRRDAINWALENAKPGDVLILAGKGHETYQIRGNEKTRFDEREIVAEYFKNKQSDICSGKERNCDG